MTFGYMRKTMQQECKTKFLAILATDLPHLLNSFTALCAMHLPGLNFFVGYFDAQLNAGEFKSQNASSLH